jgi:peptidoglycan-N-acetylglucosamine deacetylase
MILERPLDFLRVFYPGATWKVKGKEKTIYLTFDDGPVPEITPLVLDILDKFNIKATFFCVGDNVVKFPEVYAEVLRRGHRVGNHTFNHLKGFEHSTEQYLNNVKKAADVIESNLFRPPYGRIKPKQLRLLCKEYKVILWDLITRDYNPMLTADFIMANIRKLSRNGSIVVFHDSIKSQKNLFAVLPIAIEYWMAEGYEFGLL